MKVLRTISNYIEVLKVKETLLLGGLGLCSVIIAAFHRPGIFTLELYSLFFWHYGASLHQIIADGTLVLATITILIASGGANGLTNYLDRYVDAQMERTKRRVFPTNRIKPPENGLVWIIILIAIGLVLAWFIHPYVFIADLVGTIAAAVFRKRVVCVFPQGVIASYAPVLMGWFAVRSDVTAELVLLCLLITVWLPLHVWSVMVSHRNDYIKAGLTFFPLSVPVQTVVTILLVFALLLNVVALCLYFVTNYGLFYLVVSSILGIAMLLATIRLVASHASKDAWKLYKLSSFPYLGLVFIAICISLGL
ncbi:MAG: UbiA family prenyltransferase [Dehalococcoidia bacterium]|nr:UbiA family prenyltransferase [Dehalococcoidia bacterium]